MSCTTTLGAMVHLVVSIAPAISPRGTAGFYGDFIRLEIGPKRAKAVTNGAVAIANHSRKLFKSEVYVSTMAADVNQLGSPYQ